MIAEKIPGYKFVVVSNREPFSHHYKEGKIVCEKPASGLVTALEPIMETTQGTWIACSSGSADRVASDAKGRLLVPPALDNKSSDVSQYTLQRIWLNKEEEAGYYYGLANEALWPLCHIVYKRPIFRTSDWLQYKRINKRFAEKIAEEVGSDNAFVFIQDYHFALAAKYLKKLRRNIVCALFWHIPWPNPEAFRICPWKKELLEGLLSNDVLGFHLSYHGDNFLAAVDGEIEARINREQRSIVKGRHETLVRAFPISVDFDAISISSRRKTVKEIGVALRREHQIGDARIISSLDRFDYTKGLSEKLYAFDRFLTKYPQYKEHVVFFQKATASRVHLTQYKELGKEIDALVEEINWRHGSDQWIPVIIDRRFFTEDDKLALFRSSDACIVSSLHDGMNLVAKEFVSSRVDNSGVLVLSRFTGAARELSPALLINPYDREEFADAIYRALLMPQPEQRDRMKELRHIVSENTIFDWAAGIVQELSNVARSQRHA